MEALLEFADPDELLLAEDLVMLVMTDSWKEPPVGGMPEGVRLDPARRTLTMSQRGLSSNRSLFGRNNIDIALFAGCDALETCAPFRSTARHVLEGTEKLVIVHNRDKIGNLIDWFPRVKTLLLPHNIRLQFEAESRLGLPDRKSDLEELLGCTPAIGSSDLYINRYALRLLLLKCPKLRRLEASFHGDMISGESSDITAVDAVISHHPQLRSMPDVRLGFSLKRIDGSPYAIDSVSLKGLWSANMFFAEVTYLEVTLKDAEVVSCIRKFTRLRTLVVTYLSKGVHLDFAASMEPVLVELPLLQELGLSYFGDVNISTIAHKCPRLRRLSLLHCCLQSEEIADNIWDASPDRSLEFLSLNVLSLVPSIVSSVIMSCCHQVKELQLEDNAMCYAFLSCAAHTTFDVLERLTLRTDFSARDLLPEEDYVTVVQALPALRHLTTDSYDLRLLFSHLPSSKVALAWCTCTICTAEFPRVDRVQNRFWRKLQKCASV